MKIKCYQCGICCIASAIPSLQKPAGIPCQYLTRDMKCSIYEKRPQVCRDYSPSELCITIQSTKPENKNRKFLEAFGMEQYLEKPSL